MQNQTVLIATYSNEFIILPVITRELNSNGFNIIIVGNDQNKLMELRASLKAGENNFIDIFNINLSQYNSNEVLIARINEKKYVVHVLINILGVENEITDNEILNEKFSSLNNRAISLLASYFITNYFVSKMASQKYGKVLNILNSSNSRTFLYNTLMKFTIEYTFELSQRIKDKNVFVSLWIYNRRKSKKSDQYIENRLESFFKSKKLTTKRHILKDLFFYRNIT